MKVLVVDDSATMRRIIGNCLKPLADIEIVEAANGKDAMAQLDDIGQVDLALVDWNMPEMNGLELIQALKAMEAYRELPIIMVTTESEKACVVAALRAGASNYVVKPFEAEVLRTKIRQLVEV